MNNVKLNASSSRGLIFSLIVLVSVTATSCESASSLINRSAIPTLVSSPDHVITITFSADNCPAPLPVIGVCSAEVCASRTESVQWKAPADQPFEVYFDPFVGRHYKSREVGGFQVTPPAVVRRDSMPGDYKFSILALRCAGDPMDPVMRVD